MTKKPIRSKGDPKDHLSNDRTFLAWIRTSIGMMAFGFVVERFALFIKQITLLLEAQNIPIPTQLSVGGLLGFSSMLGIFLVAFGSLICILSFFEYKRVEKQIEDNTYSPSMALNLMLTIAVLLIGIILIYYLVKH